MVQPWVQSTPKLGSRVGGSTTLSRACRPVSAVESHLLLSQGQDGVGLEHVVGGGIPQPQMVCPAGGKKVVIARMKRHPRGEESVVLSRLVHLVVVVRVAIFGGTTSKNKTFVQHSWPAVVEVWPPPHE